MSVETASARDQIAIVGMACMFPQAADLAAFWANILGKRYAVSDPPPEWGAERYHGASAVPEKIYTRAGGFLGDLYRFNPAEFGIMPGSVDGQEPDQFLALKVARDALADAGALDPGRDHSRTGIILGHSSYLHRGQGTMVQHGVVIDQTLEFLRQLFPQAPEAGFGRLAELMRKRLPAFNSDTAPGVVPNVMTGRIANRLDLKGPNYLIDAACASSLLAVHAASEELLAHRSDLMLAGGVNASTPPEAFMVFSFLGGLSRKSHITPFAADADGTLLGEGLGVVVLKRLSDAERDGDRIYALVRGVGQSSDGRGLGLLAPRMEGEVLAIRRAYEQTGIDPASIGLIEAHGTGIPLGDRTEIQSLGEVFGTRDGELPRCAVGSVKSMISHCIPAAGVAGLIKATLALHHKVLPPTLCDDPNPALELERTPFYLNTEPRPWIQAPEAPRRAAVNAFGFGGVNTHAVVEEYRGPRPPAAVLDDLPAELVLIAAPDRDALLARLERLGAFLASAAAGSDVRLRDVAFTLAGAADGGPQRLALAATDLADLAAKLGKAREALADPGKRRMQTRSGVFFSDRPVDGALAFLFPGEGAQQQGMLADLAMHFPVVREWFDFWEGIFQDRRPFSSTAVVFPPPQSLTAEVRECLARRLFELEIGSESMFIASQAVSALLQRLGVRPDVMLGHSSGENSALVASGLIRLGDRASLRAHILKLNDLYQHMESAGDIATGTLMTVGAVPREAVIAAVEASGGVLHLALDNCHHQAVLFGPREAMEQAAEGFRRQGGLCAYLPFDRAYHTPLFEPVSRAIEDWYRDIPVGRPEVPIYSCVTTALFPEGADELRHLAAVQWSSRVRFTETVERMYADGVRYFLEVGPSGNLTGFVDDILRDREHLAASSNSRSRPGVLQLMQTLARLFVNGRALEPAYLFEGRHCRTLDLDAPAPAARAPAMRLYNTLPYVRLEAAEAAQVRALLAPPTAAPLSAPAPRPPAAEVAASAVTDYAPIPEGDPLAEAMAGHLRLMEAFLANQQAVFTGVAATSSAAGSSPDEWAMPFIQRVIARDDARAEAEIDLDVGVHRFIQEHILYSAHVSDLDPGLHGLPVVPLTASLEMLAEVAALVSERPCLTALERVKAYNWIALDDGAKTVRLVAELRARDEADDRVHAAIYDGELRLIEADVVFSDAAPEAHPLLPELSDPREPVWQDHELYATGMFHGPMYHSVRHLVAWDGQGIDAELAATPVTDFFGAGERPLFLLNPVLFDAVGHLTAFWIAQTTGTDFSCFPSQIERIECIAPHAEDTEGCLLRGRLAFLGGSREQKGRFLQGDYDCIGRDGRALFRISGWRDRFFEVPHSFYVARTHPRDGWFGEDLSHLFPELAEDGLLWLVPPFPPGFLEDAGAVWKRLLALTVLSAEERGVWAALPNHPKRRSEWLMGRIAVKEAVRWWLYRRTGALLFPADLVIRADTAGRPFVAGEGLEALGAMPEISIAHADGCAVAVVGPAGRPLGVDVEALGGVRVGDLVTAAFTPQERGRLELAAPEDRDELAIRMWCAKEAAAKRQGEGLNGNPAAHVVRSIDERGARAVVDSLGTLVPVSIERSETRILALAAG